MSVSSYVPSTIGGSQGVAVRAQESQVLKSIVVTDAVDVIQFEGYRPVVPLAQTTLLTAMGPQTLGDETTAQSAGAPVGALLHEDLSQRCRRICRMQPSLMWTQVDEVICLQAERIDPLSHYRTGVMGRADREVPKYPGQRGGSSKRQDDLFIRHIPYGRSLPSREVRRVDIEFPDAPPDRFIVAPLTA